MAKRCTKSRCGSVPPLNEQQAPPEGISLLSESPNLLIEYRHKGMGCFLLMISVVTGGLGLMTAYVGIHQPDEFVTGITSSWGAIVCSIAGVVAWCYWLFYLVWFLFGSIRVEANDDLLFITKRLFGLSWTHSISRNELIGFRQIKDGGEGDDTFPSWGLRVDTRARGVWILRRQSLETSAWLGDRLAAFYNLNFIPSPDRDDLSSGGGA